METSKPERFILKVVNDAEKIVGYLARHLTRCNLDAKIKSFYVLKEAQKQDVATKLLINLVKRLIDLNTKSLSVCIKPETIKGFYLKHGRQYLNEHWIFWQDSTHQLQDLTNNKKSGRFYARLIMTDHINRQ